MCGDTLLLCLRGKAGKPLDQIRKAFVPSEFRNGVLWDTNQEHQSVFAQLSRRSVKQVVFCVTWQKFTA
jgi:hypothetical protein